MASSSERHALQEQPAVHLYDSILFFLGLLHKANNDLSGITVEEQGVDDGDCPDGSSGEQRR